MTEGKNRANWARTSSLMALLANCHRGPKQKVFAAGDFNPYEVPKPKRKAMYSIGQMYDIVKRGEEHGGA